MTWWLLAGLQIGCYFFKVAGLFVAVLQLGTGYGGSGSISLVRGEAGVRLHMLSVLP